MLSRAGAALAVLAGCLALAAGAAAASGPLLLPAPIPPDLAALEARAEALQVTSIRETLSERVTFGKGLPEGLAQLLAPLFDFGIQDVETLSPPAAALRIDLFGTPIRLRIAAGHTYLLIWPLRRADGGRPWVRLEGGPLGRFFGPLAKPSHGSGSGAAVWGRFFAMLDQGSPIRELGPATVDGQAVTGFEAQVDRPVGKATVEAGLLPGSSPAFAAAAAPKLRLLAYLAASGAPVRIVVLSGSAQARLTITDDIPAIDFPYAIPPPPPSHVVPERWLSGHARGMQRPAGSAGAIEK